jgi:hypothetical protein
VWAPKPVAPQKPRHPKRPFEVIACHLMRSYPRTPTGNRFILVVTDSRWVEGSAIPRSTTSEIVRLLEEDVFTRQDYPGVIITDSRLPIHVPALDEDLSTLANTNVDDGPIYAPGNGAPQPGTQEGAPLPPSWTRKGHVGQRNLHGPVQRAPPP